MKINLVAIAKDEGRYISEWLSYHLALGFDRITVFDNESSDETSQILFNASKIYPVERIHWPTLEEQSPQISAYNFYHHSNAYDDVISGFIDIDEFLISRSSFGVVESVRAVFTDTTVGALCINQRLFGNSGLEEYSSEPVLKRLFMCSTLDYEESCWVKSFYRMSYIDELNVHSSRLLRGRHVHADGSDVHFTENYAMSHVSNIEFSRLQLNHYITKTIGEFRAKQKRGGAAAVSLDERMARYGDDFFYNRQSLINRERCQFTEFASENIEVIVKEFEDRLNRLAYGE